MPTPGQSSPTISSVGASTVSNVGQNRGATSSQVSQEALALLQSERQDPDYLLDVYEAQIAGVKTELERLADEAAQTEIVAPVSGTVLRVLEESDMSQRKRLCWSWATQRT